ncbi:MAG TPA: GAF domain-containing protein [Anaerolineales bacterium]|nr:GAF domain-containing protein [Anaerolineales bacterium]
MTSDELIQPEIPTFARAARGIAKFLRAAKDLLNIQERFSPGRTLSITIGGIALAEVVAMIFVYYVRDWPYNLQVFLDATIMVAFIFPLLYILTFRPLLAHIQQRNQADSILQARLRLMQFANTHTLDELLQSTLDEVESLTGSAIGFFHFLEADQRSLWLQAWSTNTLQNMCKAEGKGLHYDVDQAGVWADAVRQRQPVIHNNYAALPHHMGMPEGHATVVREMVIPVLRDNKVVAIVGLGNKPQDFIANDVEVVSTLADFAWDMVENMQAEVALRQSEEKFRTLVDWTYDWEEWLDPDGNIVYTSPACERITGYTPEEITADPNLLVRIIHPDDRHSYEEHRNIVHNASAGPVSVEYRLIARDGSEHWIEHICRPLFGTDDHYLGRRISYRDITKRKRSEQALVQTNELLERFFSSIDTLIAYMDRKFNFIRVNEAYARADGRPAEFFIGKNHFDLYPHEENQAIFQRVVDTGEPFSVLEKPFEYPEYPERGVTYWDWSLQPVRGLDGDIQGLVLSLVDVTERKHAEMKILEQNQKEAILTQTIHTIQTDIARDLHDTLGQNIGFLRMNLAHLLGFKLGSQVDNQIQNMTKAADESYELIRTLLALLQSGYSGDPLLLFFRYAKQVAERTAIQIDVTDVGHPNQLSPQQTRQLFYVFREALSNIEKHANAGRVSGEFLWGERALTLAISDDGRGFDPLAARTPDHFGLNFMRERAEQMKGSFSVHSAPGQGTKITVVVPYEFGSPRLNDV